MSGYKKFISKREAQNLLESQSNDFTIINNPDYIYPLYEIVPLAMKLPKPLKAIKAIVTDMDGTTTTTEELCIYSLEFMIRKMSGKLESSDWCGIDKIIDYPHIIGNSTTKHVEYLITRYTDFMQPSEILKSFIYASVWTILYGEDEKRKEEVILNLSHFGLNKIITREKIELLKSDGVLELNSIANKFSSEAGNKLNLNGINDFVRIGIDIYYQKYHEILRQISNGESSKVSAKLFDKPDKHLIEPVQGVFIFLSLVKGWLGDEIKNLVPTLIEEYEKKSHQKFDANIENVTSKLIELSNYFVINPVKTAIVTSSIAYEANIVMTEMIKVVNTEIDNYNLSDEKIKFLKDKFSNYKNIYDGFITASDSSEIRLKPHRDLYSMALHQLGIAKNEFDQVVGFEDSESGTIAIRAAGIGMCIAVPFAETSGHNLEAATYICKGGLPEVLLNYNLFL
ncbi:MAG: hypothetical protein JEY94_05660 [Melioribacteraceae bacterium]|nr:hypothetical protein [Melioribacteraceae bacterium]